MREQGVPGVLISMLVLGVSVAQAETLGAEGKRG